MAVAASWSRIATRARRALRGAARRRRRRSRHARRADGRRQGPRTPAQPLLLLGLLARRRAGRRPLADVVHGARLRLHLPQRGRPLPHPRRRRTATACPSSATTSMGRTCATSPRCPTPPTSAAPRASPSCWASSTCRTSARAAARPGPGLRGRRSARLRSALGRGLRMGLPERGVARRGDGRRARRRRGPRRGARRLPQASIAAGSGRITSCSPTSPPRARPTRSSARCTAAP